MFYLLSPRKKNRSFQKAMLVEYNRKVKRRSFTLVELLVACVIITILAGIGGVYFVQVVEKAHMSEANVALGIVRGAQIAYYNEYNNVSLNLADLGIDFTELKYFENINVSSSIWNGYLANITRRDNFRYGCYTLSIDRNGTITCTPEGAKPCPAIE